MDAIVYSEYWAQCVFVRHALGCIREVVEGKVFIFCLNDKSEPLPEIFLSGFYETRIRNFRCALRKNCSCRESEGPLLKYFQLLSVTKSFLKCLLSRFIVAITDILEVTKDTARTNNQSSLCESEGVRTSNNEF